MLKHLTMGLLLLLPGLTMADSLPLSEPAMLNHKVPASAIGYLRFPNPWGLLTGGEGSALGQALANEQIRQQVRLIESGMFQNVIKPMSGYTGPALALLFHHLRAPLESVLLLPENAPLTNTNALLVMRLNVPDADAMNLMLGELIAMMPEAELLKPLDAEGYGMMKLTGLPTFLYFDTSSRTLYLLAGITANPERFQDALTLIATPAEASPMQALEQQIDTSGQGFFYWLNLQRLMPLMDMFASPDMREQLANWGLMDVQGLALGWGASEGKGRMKLVIDAPVAGYRKLLPIPDNHFALTTAGEPSLSFSLYLPLVEGLSAVEQIMTAEGDNQTLEELATFKKQVLAETGTSLEELLSILNGEQVFFLDRLGLFAAIRIGNHEALDKLLQFMTEKGYASYQQQMIDGVTYHHLNMNMFFGMMPEMDDDSESGLFLKLFSRLGNHYYWIEQDGYLIFAQVPQMLMDRVSYPNKGRLDDWLHNTQQQSMKNAVLSLSASLPRVPRTLYYTWVSIASMLADLGEAAEMDIFSLPSASTLNLPETGSYGLEFSLNEQQIALELSFESTPLDFLLISPETMMMAASAVGISAAVAIPAYTDYTRRAKVTEGINLLWALKTPTEEYFAATGQIPSLEDLGGRTSGNYSELHTLDTQDGFYATFKDPGISGRLILRYDIEQGTWACSSEDMKQAYLPYSCRD